MRWILVSAMLTSACQSPPILIPAIAGDRLTSDDRAVIAAILDGYLAPERDHSIRAGRRQPVDEMTPTGAQLLLLDETTPSCLGDRPAQISRYRSLGCFDAVSSHGLFESLVTDREDARVGEMLVRRNQRSLPIEEPPGRDVVLIKTDAFDGGYIALSELYRRHPRGSALVTLSAPVYPRGGLAAMWYRMAGHGNGLVSLRRDGDRWVIHRDHGVTE